MHNKHTVYRFDIWYKVDGITDDITYDYFEHYDNIDVQINLTIDYHEGHQYNIYSTLDYNNITPLIHKYFTPSNKIKMRIRDIEDKYSINYDNICVLFYRGNDKNTETIICDYDEYITYANRILSQNPTIQFLVQSDETEFIECMMKAFPNNSFYFVDEIRHMSKCMDTVDIVMKEKNADFSKYYLAITIIMSKCKYIICGSGNCSIWIMMYRGNSQNVYQNNNSQWYEPTNQHKQLSLINT